MRRSWRWSRAATTAAAAAAGVALLVLAGRLLAVAPSAPSDPAASTGSSAATAVGIRVPDAIGQPLAQARTVLRAAGLRAVPADRARQGPTAVVVDQQPPAGQLVAANSVVRVWLRTDLQPNGTPRRLRLERGRTTATYPLVAPDPARHRLTVVVTVPQTAAVEVWVETGSSTRLPVLGAPGPGQGGTCQPADPGGLVRCVARFEALDAEAAGVWAVNLFKRSLRPAGIEVTVTFTPR